MKSTQVLPWLAIATGVIASPKPPGPSACGAPPDGGHQHPPPPPPPSPSPPSPPGPGPAPGPGRPVVESKRLQELIQEKNIWSTLETLNTIAYANGGNRAFGLPGYAASVDFIFGEVSKLKQFTVWKEDFEALFSQVEKISFVEGDTSYYVTGLTYSPSTTAEGVTAELISAPAGNLSCSVTNYANIDVKDKIVLVQRGACPDGSTFAGHVRPAAAAGAAAVIIYNNVETNLTAGTLSNPSPEYVATGGINLADGLALQARLDAGESITATFQQTQAVENRTTQNIFAETKYGDPSNVVMLGGHLDSVQAGPGINDDGSGTALVLELARQMDKFTSTNKLRFAWWGAEENGLLGSKAYCNSLSVDEAEDILTYLNFDMVSQGYYGVFDTDGSKHGVVAPAGSATIERIFTEHFNANGIETTEAPMTNGTDYASFWKILGKPFGGLSTGTTTDKCYHQSCDSKENVNTTTITNNVKAAAHVMATLAIDGVALLPRPEGGNATQLIARRDTIDWGYDLDALAFLEETGEQHLLTCGHDV